MSALTDPPRESFRLSMLLNDTRYRGLTFQFIALVLLIGSIAYLASNLFSNLAAAGLDISYEFLGTPAGYDINQRPIEYTSQSTHMRAAIVGILNTLIVAFLACVSATVLGVIAGVLRLSNNWLVSKLMAVYVEAFRNVPVLIWIIIIFTVMTASMPGPREFKGPDAEASTFLGSAFTSQGVFTPAPVFGEGSFLLLLVAIGSIFWSYWYGKYRVKVLFDTGKELAAWPSWAILFGPCIVTFLIMSMTFGGATNRLMIPADAAAGATSLAEFSDTAQDGKFRANFCDFSGSTASAVGKSKFTSSEAMVLSNPDRLKMKTTDYPSLEAAQAGFADGKCNMLVVPQDAVDALTASTGAVALSDKIRDGAPIAIDYPYLGNFRFTDGLTIRGSLIALWFALAIYTGAFIAENVRAGIQAISKGQTEAAASLGLRPGRIMNLVVLPQALRVIIPPLISQYLNITKNSSLAIAVGYMDVTGTLGGITLNQTGRAIETILLLMLFYLTISLSISMLMNVYNNSIKLKER